MEEQFSKGDESTNFKTNLRQLKKRSDEYKKSKEYRKRLQ